MFAALSWGASPSQTFYVPFPEADAFAALTAVQPGDPPNNIPIPDNPMYTAISIAAIADGTVIYYDQWEDGYERGHDYAAPQQATTKIWGDGNTANGFPPGLPSDLINAGTVILLTNNVVTTSPLTIDYDARDKIAATRTISVTRTYWAAGSSTLFAGCVETFDTGMWGTEYRAPIGQNLADATDSQMFEYTAFSISAARDNTTVQIDADNNGAFETTVVLNEGQTHFVSGVYVGGRVLADKPVQVILFSGDVGSNYESRDSSLLPVSRWGGNYYSPVSTPSVRGTRVWLYNPGTSAITVTNNSRVGTGSLSGGSIRVAAGSVTNVTLTENAAYRFFTASGSPFYAYSTTDSTDADTADNQAYDWSFTLIPQQLLSPQVIVGLGIGRDPTSAVNTNENGNPIWVTPVGNGSTSVVVYVDYDGDNAGPYQDAYSNRYDYSTNLVELQQAKLYDPDGDQTAMLVYVLSTNVSLAVAWGQDPLRASTGAPGLDVGTSIPPVEVIDAAKNLTVTGDSDGDGQLGPGERARYTIRASNAGRAPIPADFIVKDALPTNTTYVAGSTYYRTSTNGAWVAVTDDGSGTAFPLDVGGYRIQSLLPVKGTFEVRFDVDVVSFANLTPGAVSIVNTGTVHSVVYNRTLNFYNEYELHGSLGDRVWNDADNDGVQDVGETGINGVIVYLDVNTNGVRDAGEPYDTTSGDGDYLLAGTYIEAGTHLVRVDRSTLSSNYVATYDLDGTGSPDAASVVLAGGQDRLDVDFGYRLPARLGDFVWVDTNGNGQQDGGETGLSNVVVRLYGSNNVVMATTTSTVAGAYIFTNIAPGVYTVGFTPPAGYLFTTSNVDSDLSDSDPLVGTNRTASVTLAGGQTNLTVDAGFYLPASLSGFVRVDLNGNGVVEAGDTNGIAGVTVQLLNASSNVVASATTTSSGAYSFTNLAPGSYTVRETDLGGWYSTTDISAPNDNLIPVALTSGQSSTGNNFHDTQRAALGDFVWLDANGNGQQDDGGGSGLSNVVVRLYDTNSVVVGVATSTVSGAYAFTNLLAGAYTVGFTPPAGYLFTTSNVGADATDSDPLPGTNRTASVTLVSGQTDNTVDAGFIPAASIAGFVRVDLNGNGVAEAGDTNGIPAVTVQLLDAALNVVATTTTAADGAYSFTNLRPGAYTVRETDLAGWYSTTDITAPNDNQIPVTLAIGQNSTGNNFHDTQRTALGDLVWVDTNGNGQQDGGEPGLSNVVVRLYATNNVVLATVTSAVSGAYAFTNLSAGTYTVGFAPPANYLFTTSNVGADATDSDPLAGTNRTASVTLVSGQTDNTVDAGFIPAASIAGFVRVDLNGNGVAEAGDTNGIPAVTVQLLDAALNVVATTTTAADGAYSFTNLRPGAYTVRETDLAGWYSTTDITAPNDNQIPVTLAIGQNSTGNNFHDTQRAALGDFVWLDANGNGQQDDGGGSGLSNVVVRLYDTNSVVVGVATSTVSGAYAFTNLLAGAYTVGFTPPAGYLFTTSNVGADASDSDPLSGTNRTAAVTLASGQTDNTVDAGFYLPASLSGFVRVDLNGNGVAEAGDTNGIAGVTVQLLDAALNVVATTTTAANGAYSFANLYPGAYTVRETDLGGWYSTTDISAPNDNLIPVTLTSGQNSTGNNFHDTQRVALGDFVWVDANGNGQQDGGELGLSNVVVRLYDTNNVVVGVATSTVAGAYVFTNLPAGAYAVGFTPPANYLFTTSNVGLDASDSDPLTGTNRTAAVTLASGQTDNTVDAGFIPAASLSGFVRIDVNGNGIVEAGDTNGIAGVTVQLLSATSNVVATTTTAADGSYSFANLYPGAYIVRETDLSGWYSTTDIVAPNDNQIPVTLASGQASTGNNFHDTQRAAIGDYVWVDTNGNGQQDGGELGLSNVVVRLYTNNVVIATVTSTVSGAYAFTNLTAGTYTVGFTPPSGYQLTASNVGADASDSDPLTGTNRTAAVTLVSGQTDNTVDAGFYQPVAIGDFVWADANGNGQQDGGETGINGVTVTLFRPGYGPDGIPGNVDDANSVATATSAAGGAYSFTNLPPGTYQVGFGTASGYYRTAADQGSDTTDSDANVGTGLTTAFAVNSGQTITTIDAGYQSVTVGDFVWADANANGVQDAGESGIPGVQVQVYTAAGAPYQVREPLGTFADNFDPSGGLSGSTGTLAWAADWTAATGASVVLDTGSDYEIRIADGLNSAMTRSFVAPANTGQLKISFDYRSGAGNDTVEAQWSSNGTAWVTLASYNTAAGSSGTTNVTVATTAGTRYVRFIKTAQTGGGGTTEYMYFDNVSILAESALAPVTATTDAYGYYFFDAAAGLVSGTNYQLRVATNQTALAGLALTGQNLGGNDATDSDATLATASGFATITFTAPAAGGSDQTLDFGFKGTAALGDRVWSDLNGDGVQDGTEPGLSGVRVYIDSNGDSAYTAGEPTATTSAGGTYQIGDLLAGTYTVRVDASTLPAGVTQTYDLNGGLDHAASVTLASGQRRTDVDFGYRPTVVYAIRGQVRDDYDLDGTFSDPDLPVGGVLVSLYTDPNGDGNPADGAVISAMRTTPDGRYAFTNVLSGAYVVVESDPVYSVSTADTVAVNDNRIPVVIVSADSVGNDFLDAVDPSGYIYDVADGRIVPGGRISVSGPGAYVLMDGSSGQYMFISTNDAPSTFTIAVTPPPGYIIDPTRPAQPGSFDPTGGSNPTVLGSYESAAAPGYLVNYSAASNTYYYTFSLAPGDPPVINNNFPLVKTVTLGDRVWLDEDGDGLQDAGEAGVTNVTVRLLNAASNVVASAVTDASGYYLFTNLPPASYRVEFAPVSEYAFTVRDSAAAGDAADSDADRSTGRTDLMAVAAGATNLTVDAGLYVPAVLFGHLFVDKDGDLIRDTGDSSITNAEVRLIAGGVTVATTLTDAFGYYYFGDVPVGSVSVLVSRAGATLIDVPLTSDVRRNRGLPAVNEEAYIVYPVTSGYGVLASKPGEPLNFGFASYPLSTALDVTVYASGSEVLMDIWTVNEAGQGDIVVHAWLGGAWVEVGRVLGGPEGQVVGEGSNRYRIAVTGLEAGGAYNLKIVDEAGHVHFSDGPLTVGAVRLQAVRLSVQTISVFFDAEPGRSYTVEASTDLATWSAEYASHPTAGGWSELTDAPFVAAGGRTEVRVPVNGRARAFFRVVLQQE